MNKTAIKNFAVWARNKLISDISYKAGLLGIAESGIAEPLAQSTGTTEFYDIGTAEPYVIYGEEIRQRKKLIDLIKAKAKDSDYKTAYNYVIEEVAYTWFNRLIAIRFMEVNDYLPSHVRVLSSESGKLEPDIVTNPFDTDLEFTQSEKEKILELKNDNKLDELFRMLFIKQCNGLNELLPELFEKTNDYSELLLSISFTDQESVVYRLVNDIDEMDFDVEKEGQVEILGWLYQYYISEKHDQIINIYKGTVKKEDIPAATQLFTTDWVVRYMVDNSLGRYWIERNPQSNLADKLDFFVTPKDGTINYVDEKVYPTDLTFFDPCMGSGHILVYAFDVLMEIYRECGYSDRDAALSIVQNNLYGMDIDKRAYQLAYFAVMMKARSYNRRALTQGIFNIAVCEESNSIDKFNCEGITNDKEQNKIGEYLIDAFKDAQEVGTLQTIKNADYKSFAEYLMNLENKAEQLDIFSMSWITETLPKMLQFTKQAVIMSKKYAVVCTNPPYMGKLEGQLKKFVIDNYKPYSGDLFSVFIFRNFDYCKKDGYSAFMTPFVWMFIKTYEQLRNYIIDSKALTTLVQMEYSAFEEATVPICSFILKNGKETSKGLYFRLSEFKGGMEVQKQKVLEALDNKECGYFYESEQSNFSKIPGSPIAYWVSENTLKIYGNEYVGDIGNSRKGMATGKNEEFVRAWYEVEFSKIGFAYNRQEARVSGKTWFPYANGGTYRKWFGNNIDCVLWKDDGYRLQTEKIEDGSRLRAVNLNLNYIFNKGITWNSITSSKNSFRFLDKGYLFSSASNAWFGTNEKYILSFLNSNVSFAMLKIKNPTLNANPGDISALPICIAEKEVVEKYTDDCINISRNDWDSFETSWDFKKHPLCKTGEDKSIFVGMKVGEERWIKALKNGSACFSPVEDFIKKGEKTGNNEQGDTLEGVFARLRNNSPKICEMRIRLGDDLEEIKDGNYVLLRRKSCKTVPIFCMYGFFKEDAEIESTNKLENGNYEIKLKFTPSEKMFDNFLNSGNDNENLDTWSAGFSIGHLQYAIEQKLYENNIKHLALKVEYDLFNKEEFFIEPTEDYPELGHKHNRLAYQKELRYVLPQKHQSDKYIVEYNPLNDCSMGISKGAGVFVLDVIGHNKKASKIQGAYEEWEIECENRFNVLKANEEELNRIFIDIYGLQDELTPDVEDKDVTVRKADLQRDIKAFISYAVGCMFGRYSLDVDGLAYAGGEWDSSKYSTFIPDEDNCIPITDEEYFEDDIVGLFCAWLKKVYGEKTLEENLDFIANALGNKGKTSREVIRNYFLTNFIKDHIKVYQKRPIYWLFDSGKQNGFKALIYMHRWNADTIGNLRVDYLHRMQRTLESEVNRMQDMIDNSTNNREITTATKRKEKLQKQIKECQEYDEKIGHLALSRIDIDLDDGVKVNYEKVQTAQDGKKYQVLMKI